MLFRETKMKAARRKLEPPVEISADNALAYVICFSVYSQGCICRDQGRNAVCDNMRTAALNARWQVEKENASDD